MDFKPSEFGERSLEKLQKYLGQSDESKNVNFQKPYEKLASLLNVKSEMKNASKELTPQNKSLLNSNFMIGAGLIGLGATGAILISPIAILGLSVGYLVGFSVKGIAGLVHKELKEEFSRIDRLGSMIGLSIGSLGTVLLVLTGLEIWKNSNKTQPSKNSLAEKQGVQGQKLKVDAERTFEGLLVGKQKVEGQQLKVDAERTFEGLLVGKQKVEGQQLKVDAERTMGGSFIIEEILGNIDEKIKEIKSGLDASYKEHLIQRDVDSVSDVLFNYMEKQKQIQTPEEIQQFIKKHLEKQGGRFSDPEFIKRVEAKIQLKNELKIHENQLTKEERAIKRGLELQLEKEFDIRRDDVYEKLYLQKVKNGDNNLRYLRNLINVPSDEISARPPSFKLKVLDDFKEEILLNELEQKVISKSANLKTNDSETSLDSLFDEILEAPLIDSICYHGPMTKDEAHNILSDFESKSVIVYRDMEKNEIVFSCKHPDGFIEDILFEDDELNPIKETYEKSGWIFVPNEEFGPKLHESLKDNIYYHGVLNPETVEETLFEYEPNSVLIHYDELNRNVAFSYLSEDQTSILHEYMGNGLNYEDLKKNLLDSGFNLIINETNKNRLKEPFLGSLNYHGELSLASAEEILQKYEKNSVLFYYDQDEEKLALSWMGDDGLTVQSNYLLPTSNFKDIKEDFESLGYRFIDVFFKGEEVQNIAVKNRITRRNLEMVEGSFLYHGEISKDEVAKRLEAFPNGVALLYFDKDVNDVMVAVKQYDNTIEHVEMGRTPKKDLNAFVESLKMLGWVFIQDEEKVKNSKLEMVKDTPLYHGEFSRDEVEKQLEVFPNGSALLYFDNEENDIVIAIKHEDNTIGHEKMKLTPYENLMDFVQSLESLDYHLILDEEKVKHRNLEMVKDSLFYHGEIPSDFVERYLKLLDDESAFLYFDKDLNDVAIAIKQEDNTVETVKMGFNSHNTLEEFTESLGISNSSLIPDEEKVKDRNLEMVKDSPLYQGEISKDEVAECLELFDAGAALLYFDKNENDVAIAIKQEDNRVETVKMGITPHKNLMEFVEYLELLDYHLILDDEKVKQKNLEMVKDSPLYHDEISRDEIAQRLESFPEKSILLYFDKELDEVVVAVKQKDDKILHVKMGFHEEQDLNKYVESFEKLGCVFIPDEEKVEYGLKKAKAEMELAIAENDDLKFDTAFFKVAQFETEWKKLHPDEY